MIDYWRLAIDYFLSVPKSGSVGGPLLVVSCTCLSGSWLKYKDMEIGMISLWNHLDFFLLQRTTIN